MLKIDQKERLQSFFDMLPDQLLLIGADERVALLNASAARHWGAPPREAEGKTLDQAMLIAHYGAEMGGLPQIVTDALKEGAELRFESRAGVDEAERVYEVSVRRANQECCFDGVLVNIHDITRRSRVQHELVKRNSALKELLNVNRTIAEINAAVHSGATLDEMFEIIFDQIRRIIPYDRIGLSLLDEAGENLSVVKVKSDNPIVLTKGYRCRIAYTNLPVLLNSSVVWRDEYSLMEGGRRRIIHDLERYVSANKRESHYNSTLLKEGIRSSLTVPLYVEGKPTGFIFFSSREPNVYTPESLGTHYETCMNSLAAIQDNLAVALEKAITITRLEETNRRLKELLEMKDDFLSIASHDLRSPLTAIIGFGKMMLEKTTVNELQRKGLEIMVNSAGHLLILVDDMLALAKQNAARMDLNLAPFTVGDILRDSMSAMAFNAHNKEIVIDLTPLNPSPELTIDRSKIFQVFNNLISNAIKFSPVGGHVLLAEKTDDGFYRFEVKDSGPGISAEDQKKLFHKYSQVGDDASKAKGTGLGLAICKMIVAGHGGDIGVESQPGGGSTFFFTLPLKGK